METEAADHTRSSANRPTISGRLKSLSAAVLPQSWQRDRTGFSRLENEDDAPPAVNSAYRPSGYWCPEEAANFWSKLFFCYVDGILKLGYSKPLVQDDVWDLAQTDQAETVSADFDSHLKSEPHRGSVLRALWRCYSGPFVWAGVLKLVHDIVMFTGPLFLQELLKALEMRQSVWVGLGLAIGLGLSSVAETLLINQYFHILFRISLHTKVSLINMLFSKSLRISSSVRSSYGVGAIVNLQSNDAAKLYNLSQYLHMLWSGPLQILVVMGMLVRVVHWLPAACGLASTIALIPASIFTGRKLAAIRKQLMLQTDARIKLCSEVVTGVKAIKFYAWEGPYLERISALRDTELKYIRRAALWGILNNLIFFGGPIIISLASFTTYSVMGYPLTADVAFVSLALFNLLRFPVMMFPNQIMNIINGQVALQRIQKFMEEEEMVQPPLDPGAGAHQAAIRVTKGTFAWESEGEPALRSVDLEVLSGQLLMVVGEVGSGKSSLLSALLGEMKVWSGDVHVAGTVAYTAQDPWIQNASLRDNILMGQPWEQERYAAVLKACALQPDLDLLPAGDMSEIGEKGINLSGGQRHRVALARACYAASDVVLLDDPLSAVDAHVGQHLWAQCICGLLAPRTRVLVTHHMHFLAYADLIAVVQHGKISHLGTFEALEAEVDFHQFELAHDEDEAGDKQPSQQQRSLDASPAVHRPQPAATATPAHEPNASVSQHLNGGSATHLDAGLGREEKCSRAQPGEPRWQNGHATEQSDAASTSSRHSGDAADEPLPPRSGGGTHVNGHAAFVVNSNGEEFVHVKAEDLETDAVHLGSMLSADLEEMPKGPLQGLENKEDVILSMDELEKHENVALLADKAAGNDKGKIVKVEERSIGSVKRSVYWAYIKAWGPLWLPVAILGAAVLERGIAVAQNYWLKVWSDATAVSEADATSTDTPLYMSVYFVFGVATLAIMVLRSTSVVLGTVAAARSLHRDLLHKVVRMPMSFFDSQPTGRLLNRFSRDTEALDTSLGNTVSSFLTCSVSVVGAMLVVLAVTPAVLFAVIPLSVAYYQVQLFYIATSRELKRLDSLAMSPIFGHFSESIGGLLTLRAFRMQATFTATNHQRLDRSNRVYWVMQNVNRWLSVRLELLGVAVVCGTALVVTIFPTNAGLAGLALTSALNLTGLMNWMVRMCAELEVSMNSVERMIEYMPMESEAPAVVDDSRPPDDWPHAGAIDIQNLVVRYRPELPPVIGGLSFATRAREKIGVAGRTGCGKSTLMMALFRIVEPCGGRILIDGLNVSRMGLTDLRSRLALVPQDPVIFSGTVRSNLDPFGQAGSDADIWGALQQAGLADTVQALQGGLDAVLSEGGGNLSTGQRQLLCMARALLRHARILVLDEATSNVDPATDALIQSTIRSSFADCTTLTIAHRLHTIMDSDRVLILEAGRLLEFDSPRNLLKNPASAFSKLCAESRRHRGGRSRGGSVTDLTVLEGKKE